MFPVLMALLLAAASSTAGNLHEGIPQCGTRVEPHHLRQPTDVGGRHITAQGVLRVLLVFASFPDDETPHPYWPARNPPLFMNQFIDPDTATRSQSAFNLTNYFRQMSMGKFHLVGDALWVESARSQEEYRTGAYGRANRNVLEERVDALVDFALYDHWTKQADHVHVNIPDGQVDMIIMIWRTAMWQFFGEASLGYNAGFVLDGKRIEMGFPEYLPSPLGSGVTCQYVYSDTPRRIMQTMVHEVGHWLLGGPHPYHGESPQGKHNYWGMLCNPLRTASCANAYERERLDWITVPEIVADTHLILSDYLTTGSAYKYRPPNGEPAEFFYFENHQRLSVFDDVTINPADKGIWILHQQGPYMELDNLKIRPSDGMWKWENPGTSTACFSQQLPVFTRGVPRTHTGVSHRSQIPMATSLVNWMRVLKGNPAAIQCGVFYAGERFNGAFGSHSSLVFSPFSNPNSNTWSRQPTSFSLEIVRDSVGTITFRRHSNPLNGSPARRYLGNDPTVQGIPPGMIALAWGSQWPEGQLIEPDVNLSQLERQIGTGGNWISVYEGSDLSWIDGSIPYDTNGRVPVFFRVRVRDTDGHYSVWSDTFKTATSTNAVFPTQAEHLPVRFELRPNYPNPFNPSTVITYAVPAASRIRVTVFDVLGREVRLLVNGTVQAGLHRTLWDGNNENGMNAASGIYFCRLDVLPDETGSGKFAPLFVKMMLTK